MLFWILVATLTAAVAAVLLLPLLRAAASTEAPQSHDVEVYRDQLEELKRDETSGLISGEDAGFARAEVARRLLVATDAVKAAGPARAVRRSNRLAQLAIILILPAVGLCLYLRTGSPDMPDAPLAARLANPGNDMNILIARAEQQLVANPDDGAGWDVLAPIYYRSGRVEDAAAAFRNALRILGATPARLGGYAESLIALSGGLVTTEAQDALQKSLAIEPNDPRAQFYLALALKQEGKAPEALAAFQQIARTSPAGAPWLPLVNEHIAGLTAAAAPAGQAAATLGNPTGEDIAAAQEMNAGDRTAMIEGMVGSLAEKLKEDPKNFEGWMRIIRSYSVLGRKDEAADALKQGLAAFPADSDEGKQLLALAGELGLTTDGGAQ
ncbi:cytochrome C biogenesis protein CycH [Pararhizobium polonicum]|uniref:Cytochrome C biogenesis protein CycH n=1 Tax=Pararhizobium polonicum TaxID=1612624 RepID=A0A1C7P423_9HYPH|nr:c-type cytochrome biogenesis protein CcmI [Pararhizobium polonicum]OBZ96032.1 cytochrome C biogenesis protein CycH [Pararhizobium polonicum]